MKLKQLVKQLREVNKQRKKGLINTTMAIVTTLIVLFIGVFMISKVSTITQVDSSSPFYNVHSDLVNNTGTVYSVLILVLIVAALGVAIWYLRNKFITPETSSAAV